MFECCWLHSLTIIGKFSSIKFCNVCSSSRRLLTLIETLMFTMWRAMTVRLKYGTNIRFLFPLLRFINVLSFPLCLLAFPFPTSTYIRTWHRYRVATVQGEIDSITIRSISHHHPPFFFFLFYYFITKQPLHSHLYHNILVYITTPRLLLSNDKNTKRKQIQQNSSPSLLFFF